jgi:ribosomal protein L37AE/L43A
MPETPLAANAAADKHAEAMDWEICHFCKRYSRCKRWFTGWRCSDCRAASMPPPNPRASL